MADPEMVRQRVHAAAQRLGLVDPSVIMLAGGSRNRSYRLTGAGRDVVVRIGGDNDPAFDVVRATESRVHTLVSSLGLAPGVLLDDPAEGLLVTEYLGDRVWSRERARSAQGIEDIAAWLQCLHGAEVPTGLRRVDFASSLEYYRRVLRGVVPESVLRRAVRTRNELARDDSPALCHNDLHHRNLIDFGERLVAVDWEYAGAGDRVMDLAGFVAYHDLDGGASARLLEAYCRPGVSIDSARLESARWLFEAVWLAWLELRRRLESEESADDHQTRRRLAERVGIPVS